MKAVRVWRDSLGYWVKKPQCSTPIQCRNLFEVLLELTHGLKDYEMHRKLMEHRYKVEDFDKWLEQLYGKKKR